MSSSRCRSRSDRSSRTAAALRARGLAAGIVASIALTAWPLGAAENENAARRVLIVGSFGNRFAPFDAFTASLRGEIARQWPGPVEFLEVPLEMARYAQPAEEGPFAEYLAALLRNRRPDLAITVGGSAAQFALRHREPTFADAPLLITGLDARRVRDVPDFPNQAVVAVHLELVSSIESILHLLPGTNRIAVVVGDSPLERFWRVQAEREFAVFQGRVEFQWLNRLSLQQMRDAVAALPPNSAVLFGILNVDAAGIAHEENEALATIRSASSAPVFGLFESELGKGIVGGPLVDFDREGRRSAAVALAILRGAVPSRVPVGPVEPLRSAYDWRELRRWGIDEHRLPDGSEIRYRPPSLWQAYRRPVFFGSAVLVVEALLIMALLAQRAHRRRAEERVRALNRRLITAQEDERKSLARELHDDLSQRLARLSIDAAGLEKASGPSQSGATEIRGELSRMSEDVHRLAYQLHPSTLDDLGLTEALRIECDRVARLESVPVRLQAPEESPPVSRDAALGLFRIAQEALRNAVRHAGARGVDLTLEPAAAGVRLSIRDDGSGFDPGAERGRPSLGLASMRERADLFGGSLEVRSAPGRGTTVEVWAPAPGGAS